MLKLFSCKIPVVARACILVIVGGLFVASSLAADSKSEGEKMDSAIFAGGCFWCLQPAFDGTEGVVETFVGFTGGHGGKPPDDPVPVGRTGRPGGGFF